jgi:hypothetical protein
MEPGAQRVTGKVAIVIGASSRARRHLHRQGHRDRVRARGCASRMRCARRGRPPQRRRGHPRGGGQSDSVVCDATDSGALYPDSARFILRKKLVFYFKFVWQVLGIRWFHCMCHDVPRPRGLF